MKCSGVLRTQNRIAGKFIKQSKFGVGFYLLPGHLRAIFWQLRMKYTVFALKIGDSDARCKKQHDFFSMYISALDKVNVHIGVSLLCQF